MVSTTDIPGPRVPMRNSTSRTDTGPSVSSKTSKNSGPSSKEPAFIKSTWGIGWLTPTLMLVSYVSALAIAIGHLLLFRFLDGKEADGHHQVIAQSYVSTASNILANIFGFLFRGSLAIAFIQYLWHLLRVSTMKVSTIELLFSIRSNPFVLFRPAALRATPFLFALSIVMWASQIVTSFPPGAITVATIQQTTFGTVIVPNFNASFMGNGSGAAANQFSLANLNPSETLTGFTASGFQLTKAGNLLLRMSFPVMVKGESFTSPSPCGVNCSYVTEFEGPYLECSNKTTYLVSQNGTQEIYSGTWTDPRVASVGHSLYNGTFSIASFNSSVLTPLGFNNDNKTLLIQRDSLSCLPGRAKFTVNNTYTNNIQTRTVSADPISRLVNLDPLTHDSEVTVPGFVNATTYAYGTAPANWSTDALNFYRDLNHISIISAMMYYLEGNVIASDSAPSSPSGIDTSPSGMNPPGQNGSSNGSAWSYVQWSQPIVENSIGECVGLNDTIIAQTRFNNAFGRYSSSQPANPSFNLTQDSLNEQLFNVTASMMVAFGTWDTTTNATVLQTVTVYSFSRPLNLILPYFISLLLAIPFLAMGGLALHKNGVSAIDGGFMQIIATSTGSAILDKAAAGGCLGGDESAPQELKDLEIRFGEIVGREEPGRIKRAGFGVESEVTVLKKGDNYGIARWI